MYIRSHEPHHILCKEGSPYGKDNITSIQITMVYCFFFDIEKIALIKNECTA